MEYHSANMALTGVQRWKRWYSKPENKKKVMDRQRAKRRFYRKAYVEGRIKYSDIPKSCRYFKP